MPRSRYRILEIHPPPHFMTAASIIGRQQLAATLHPSRNRGTDRFLALLATRRKPYAVWVMSSWREAMWIDRSIGVIRARGIIWGNRD